ncbi:hypothetical protein MKEN_01072200 [Mycena kentingensis (nom. inval.)]|nr:hypothetical protein MKEN_01072200 [Mycena kentingensis (nom. inval.)]
MSATSPNSVPAPSPALGLLPADIHPFPAFPTRTRAGHPHCRSVAAYDTSGATQHWILPLDRGALSTTLRHQFPILGGFWEVSPFGCDACAVDQKSFVSSADGHAFTIFTSCGHREPSADRRSVASDDSHVYGSDDQPENQDDGATNLATEAHSIVDDLPLGVLDAQIEDVLAEDFSLDANFRLKNRIRANERHDRATCPGWGCFVDDGPYKEHLQDYVAEEDISTCIAFAALMQKETKVTTGLRVSGVGGCVCARHGVVRPQGLGDLQKGERYANMDYIFIHAIRDARVKQLVVSYDVVCQWKVYLRTRVLKILEDSTIPTDLDKFDIQFALPVWHATAHEEECQMANSLSYTRGVGRTDGEGIERTWAVLNTMSYATKEMSLPNRLDSLEDKVDRINFEKNVGEGDALPRKLVIAVAERDKQIAEFVEVDSSLDPAVRREWLQQVRDWEADKTKPNPYVVAGGKSAGPSEAQVAAALKAAEVKEAREGQGEFVDGKMTATAFIKGLLQLENLKIKNELKGSTTLTADRASQIDELRASFFKKLKAIRAQQDVFMPGVAALRAAAEELRDPDRPAPKAEDTAGKLQYFTGEIC